MITGESITDTILSYLMALNDDLVVTYLRTALSVCSMRILERDGYEVVELPKFAEYHRKVIGLLLESLDHPELEEEDA